MRTEREWIKARYRTVGCIAAAAWLGGFSVRAMGQEGAKTDGKPSSKRQPIYDESADAKSQIAEALKRAGRENKRVLVMFGANWCGWCYKLHDVFKEDPAVGKTLQYEYERVMVDIGRRDKNLDIATGYGVALEKEGVPFLTVLDAGGKVLANQETGSLEAGERHDPEKVQAFLKRWAAPPLDARRVADAALAQAKSQGKMVFVRLGAPWCGWCHKLDDFVARKDIAAILARDFLDTKLDLDRMQNAKEVAGRFRSNEDSGLPWFAFVDADGKVLASSEGPEGNVGFPAAPAEIAHFAGMLKKHARNITADQIAMVERLLQEAAKPEK